MEHDILISLGSNHDANNNMQHAHEALRCKFADAYWHCWSQFPKLLMPCSFFVAIARNYSNDKAYGNNSWRQSRKTTKRLHSHRYRHLALR